MVTRTRRKNYIHLKPNLKQNQAVLNSQTPSSNDTSSSSSKEVEQSKQANVTLKDALDKLYEDIESAPSFSAKIEAYLRNNAVHSRHRRIVKKKFPRRKIIARFPFEIFMADLLEYPQYKHVNRNYVFALIIIDCFTKKIWAVPMKRKTSEYTAQAFESVFRDFDQFPIHIVTDRGLEFYNTEVQKIFKNYGINHYSTPTRTKWKASMAERVIRTLKSRLQKYFVKFKTHKWIDVLPQIVNGWVRVWTTEKSSRSCNSKSCTRKRKSHFR